MATLEHFERTSIVLSSGATSEIVAGRVSLDFEFSSNARSSTTAIITEEHRIPGKRKGKY